MTGSFGVAYPTPWSSSSGRRHRQPHAKRIKQLAYRFVSDLCTWRESLVEALPSQACVLCHFGKTPRLGNIRHGLQEHIGIGVLQSGREVLGNNLLVVRIIGRVKRRNSQSTEPLPTGPAVLMLAYPARPAREAIERTRIA